MDKIVADTSVIINGLLAAQIESGSLRTNEIVIPQAVFDELQAQAANNRDQGFVGLEKLGKLRDLSDSYGSKIIQMGEHITHDEVDLAGDGRIDAIITDTARQTGAVLCTSDRVQNLAAKAQGIDTIFLHDVTERQNLEFLRFFDAETMSVHLKENQRPLAKRGRPGSFELVEVGGEPLERKYLETISAQILDAVNVSEKSTIEISKEGATVVQYEDYRIAITHPPFSESFEITVVHPIVKMSLDDYEMPSQMMERFKDRAEGIVISGSPGSGKSTLASSLGNFYHKQGKIVKTFESPRDLQVDSGVTQYSKLEESFDNSADILLLVRPDYTIFDEVRRREDFETFADLRMTGVGMVGVVHANSPIDAIQRFIGKIELGMIPSVLDTVVFVKDGRIDTVYDLELAVKVPSGMTESDLARPVIVIKNYADGSPAYEIYTFGEENVIVPVSAIKGGRDDHVYGVYKLAEEKILEVFRKYDRKARVEIVSDRRAKVIVAKKHKAMIIGKKGSRIEQIEKMLKMSLDIVTREELESDDLDQEFTLSNDDEYENYDGRDYNSVGSMRHSDRDGRRGASDSSMDHKSERDELVGDLLSFDFSMNRNIIYFDVGKQHQSKNVEIRAFDDVIAMSWINKKGLIKIPTRTRGGRAILDVESPEDNIMIALVD